MRNITYVNQLPVDISAAQLDWEIKALSIGIRTIYSLEKVIINESNEIVVTEPRSVVCYNVPDEITDLQVKQIINAHVPEIQE